MRLPVPPFLSLTAAIPAVGAARRAVTLYRELIAQRVPFGTHKTQNQRAAAQIRFANAFAEVRATEVVLRHAARAIERHARGEATLSTLEQVELRLTITCCSASTATCR
jgi:alkylation response protein AidB-like acyl-CoA dehydrogenase